MSLRDRLRNDELETVSRRDALTGLSNRRALDLAIARREAADDASGALVGVLLIDIDFFKTYNDDNGHLAGDACLRRIAAIIEDDPRLDRDSAFRFGGEEFLTLVEDCTAKEARAIAERVRAAVERAAIPRSSRHEGVMTVSVGVEVAEGGRSLTEAIAKADDALYSAKAAGRNRVRTLNEVRSASSLEKAA